MAISVGQRFVRRHDAARGSTPNATAADIAYDTAVISEGGYSWSSPEVTVDTDGIYLYIGDIGQVDFASTRAVGTLVPAVNGVNQNPIGLATHRYLRNSGGAEGASFGTGLLNLSASDAVKVRNPGTGVGQLDALGNYATRVNYGGGLQLIRFPSGNFTQLTRNNSDADVVGISNINTTRPWIDSSGTWQKLTWQTESQDDDNLAADLNGDVVLKANKKYMVVWGTAHYSTDSSRHTYVTALNINGTRVQTGTGYQRTAASQCPPMTGIYFHEVGGANETIYLEATQEIEGADAGNPQFRHGFLQVLELPDSAEWIHADNGASDSMTTALAGTGTYYDTPLSSNVRADANSNLSLDAANNAVQNDSGGDLSVLAIGWHRWDRDSGSSGTRKMPWSRWLNDGTALGYGINGAFSRGQQGSDDNFQAHYCAAATFNIANSSDIKFQANEPASGSNADMGIYASTNRHFLGVQVLDLSSLEAVSSSVQIVPDYALHSHISDTPALATSETLSVNDSSHSHAVESPSLTSNYQISPIEALHAHTSEEPSLSSGTVLNVSDGLHSHSSELPVLDHKYVLVPDVSAHGHVSESPILTVSLTLEPNDSIHLHTSGSPSVSSGTILSANDGVHQHTANQATLIQEVSISPDSSVIAHTSEFPTLFHKYVLSSNNGNHFHVSGEPILVFGLTLSVNSGVNGHISDSVALAHKYQIAPIEALHNQFSGSPALFFSVSILVDGALHAHTAETPDVSIPIIENKVFEYESDFELTLYFRSTALTEKIDKQSFFQMTINSYCDFCTIVEPN